VPKVFLNDGIKDFAQAALPVNDGGLLYGAGIFETMRARNSVIFALDDHIARLTQSATVLNIPSDYTPDFLKSAVAQTLAANSLTDARLRLTLTSGPVQSEKPRATLLITASPFESYPPEYYKKGVRVILSSCRQNATDPTAGHKTTSYFPRLLMLDLARRKGAAEALWFTHEGILAEGSISNVFIMRDEKLCTPALSTPVLAGITRKHVLALAPSCGLETLECDLTINDLLAAPEIFITNSVMQIIPVTSVEAHSVADSKPGPVTKKLMKAFTEHFEKQTSGMI